MIGDWVILYDRPRKIERVYDYGRVQVGCIEEDCTVLEPIPLTPEILEKSRFEKLGFNGWEFSEQDNDNHSLFTILWRNDYAVPHLRIRSFVQKYGEFSSFNIRYVHELQHALRLCGIEKEIVI